MLIIYLVLFIKLILLRNEVESNSSFQLEIDKKKIYVKLKSTNYFLIGNRKLLNELNDKNEIIKTNIVYEFLGVPFAQPPLNEKRFQFPHRLNKLLPNEIYDATYARDSCMQEFDTTFPGFSGSEMWNPPGNVSEDCLHMNIWVPLSQEQDDLFRKESEKSSYDDIKYLKNGFSLNTTDKATLFWIYGGSFNSGTAYLSVYDGTFLASFGNVIVVSSNYRVGPFGFLYFDTENTPGNAGLADQILAIEWYRENYLAFFGGSKNQVCLFSESAGSISAHYLLLSRKNYLFNRVIFESLSAYLDVAYRTPKDALQVSLKFANIVGCLTDNEFESITKLTASKKNNLIDRTNKCLLSLNATYLSQKQFDIDYVNNYLKMQFVPTLDYNNFITQDPSEYSFYSYSFLINKQINHDLLVGVNQNEGSYFLFYLYNNVYYDLNGFLQTNLTYDNRFVVKRVAEALNTIYPTKSDMSDGWYGKYINCLANLYTVNGKTLSFQSYDDFFNKNYSISYDLDTDYNKKKNSPELAWKKVSKIVGDVTFACPAIKLANEYSDLNAKRTSYYRFNKRAKSNPWPKWLGVMHGYEIEYVFGVPFRNASLYDDDDRLISKQMINSWANFAKTGKILDDKGKRSYFVDFSQKSKLNLSQKEEFNLFNKLFSNCEFLNKLTRKQSFEAKYKLCLNFLLNVKNNEHKIRKFSRVDIENLENDFESSNMSEKQEF